MSQQVPKAEVAKVKKLIALSQSSNEHEAALARDRAEAILAKHGMTALTLFQVMNGQDLGASTPTLPRGQAQTGSSREVAHPSPGEEETRRRKGFTDLGVRRLKIKSKQYEVSDRGDNSQTGLSVIVSPSGTRTFMSRYCLHDRWVKRSIGRIGENSTESGKENFSVEAARERVRLDRAMANEGKDPRQEYAGTAKLSVDQAITRYIEGYAKKAQKSWGQTDRMLRCYLAPWMNRPVASIARADLRKLLQDLQDEGKDGAARVTLAWSKAMWRWMASEEIVEHPIFDVIKLHGVKATRDRFYSDAELAAMWKGAGRLKPEEAAYVRLMILWAPRKTALAAMRWDHLDKNMTVWTVPSELTKTKKGKKRVYLTPVSPLASGIIQTLDRRSERVFPSLRVDMTDDGRPNFISVDLAADLKKKKGVPSDLAWHTFRHTVSTWLENHGHDEFDRGLVLNHASSGVTAGYSHGYPIERKRQVLLEWEKHIRKLI